MVEALRQKETDIFQHKEIVWLGNKIPIITAGWGDGYDNHLSTQEKIVKWGKNNLTSLDRDIIDSYGFSHGYSYRSDRDVFSLETRQENIERIVDLVETLMKKRGWQEANLFLSSVSIYPNTLPAVIEELKKKGLKINDSVFYGLACDGGGGAFLDALGQGTYKDQPTVFLAYENLSGQPIPPSNLKMSTLFGNGASGIALIPGQEVDLVDPRLLQAVVERDEKGVIKMPQAYNVSNYEYYRRPLPPPWYRIAPNAQKTFLFGDGIVINTIPTQEGDQTKFGDMDGIATAILFRNLIVKVTKEMLDKYSELFPGQPLSLGIFHQPSRTILENVKSKLKQFEHLEIPWLMEKNGFNNVSSATFWIAFAEAVKQKKIIPNDHLLIGTYGLGSSAHVGVVRFTF